MSAEPTTEGEPATEPAPEPGPRAETVPVEPSESTRTSAIAGIALVALLIAGAASAVTGRWGPGLENWLVLLHAVNAGDTGLALAALTGVRVVDLVALVLAGVTFLGMRRVLGAANRVWVGIAAALPLAGIALLLVTGDAGRSALTAGGLLLGWRMTKCDRFRLLGWAGLIANGLLLLADLAATGLADSAAADVVAVGYALLIGWLIWLVARMLRPLPGRPVPVGVHLVGPGGGCRIGGSDTTELFDLPLLSRADGCHARAVPRGLRRGWFVRGPGGGAR
jgi:hypothetical protein